MGIQSPVKRSHFSAEYEETAWMFCRVYDAAEREKIQFLGSCITIHKQQTVFTWNFTFCSKKNSWNPSPCPEEGAMAIETSRVSSNGDSISTWSRPTGAEDRDNKMKPRPRKRNTVAALMCFWRDQSIQFNFIIFNTPTTNLQLDVQTELLSKPSKELKSRHFYSFLFDIGFNANLEVLGKTQKRGRGLVKIEMEFEWVFVGGIES